MLKDDKMLQREQLKAVFGGSGGSGGSGGTCRAYWPDGGSPNLNGSFTWYAQSGTKNGNRWDFIGTNAEDARNLAMSNAGGKWCCSSCSTASWLYILRKGFSFLEKSLS